MHLKAGVIGLGKIGKIHYHSYKNNKNINKVYLVDKDKKALANLTGEKFSDYRSLAGKVDLVSIASPTATHYKIANFFLQNKIPVLVEKPITANINQAKKLIEVSRRKKTLLFVGHVERYNNGYLAIKKMVKNPLFIEADRLSPYPYRSINVSVILDLMIHDLDIVLNLVKKPIRKIQAKGVKVLSPAADIANARITFSGSCVANITSSRISAKKERKIRIFMKNKYISLDYAKQIAKLYQKRKNKIITKNIPIEKEQPLQKEIKEFINLVKNKKFSTNYATTASNALKLALNIQKKIK
jgi:predicted dehydrogenase